jgi:octaprenyl-diphosphate synthase
MGMAVDGIATSGIDAGVSAQLIKTPLDPGAEMPMPDALTRLAALLDDDLRATNRTIIDNMASEVTLIPQLAAHIVAAGGKRLRPLLTLAAARLCDYDGYRHVGLAACVEFIHTATLLHDDVVDESQLRRGLASANAIFGNKASVLVGDFLFARAFELMVKDGSLDVLRILSHASATIAEGEVLQLTTQNDLGTNAARYFQVIEGKTAALFAAACEVGAVVAGQDAEVCAALRHYGRDLGMAFQLIDDALDYAADEEELGKTVGDDFREGKLTYPVLLAYGAGDSAEQAFWRRTIEDGDQNPADLAKAFELIARHAAIEKTLDRAREFAAQAQAALMAAPANPLRVVLLDVADYTVSRRH